MLLREALSILWGKPIVNNSSKLLKSLFQTFERSCAERLREAVRNFSKLLPLLREAATRFQSLKVQSFPKLLSEASLFFWLMFFQAFGTSFSKLLKKNLTSWKKLLYATLLVFWENLFQAYEKLGSKFLRTIWSNDFELFNISFGLQTVWLFYV